MARSRRTATREEVEAARQPDPDDSSEAPSAPENNDDDAASNPPDQQEGDFAPDGLDNLDAIIRRDMIAMYVRVLGFKPSTTTNKLPTQTAFVSLTTLRSRSSAARSARRATLF